MDADRESKGIMGLVQRLKNSCQKAYGRFLKIRGTPREIALGFALGLFVGMSPSMGVQMAIAVFLAALLKWNKISAAVGVWISNPFSAPFLYGLTFFVGKQFTGVSVDLEAFGELDFAWLYHILLQTPEIFWAMLIGGVIAGIPVAIAGYYFSYSAVEKYQQDIKAKLTEKRERLSMRKSRITAIRKNKRRKKKDDSRHG